MEAGGDSDDDVAMIMSCRIADSTKRAYIAALKRIAKWLVKNKFNHTVTSDLEIISTEVTLGMVKKFLADQLEEKVGISRLKIYRSALTFLFEEKGATEGMVSAYKFEMKKFFGGLKRIDAKRRKNGETRAPIKEGKEALPFDTYREICTGLLRSEKDWHLWAHCYMILSWNLMCRCNNTAFIRFDQIEWKGDALLIYFATTKADQTGERCKHPIHVYANPVTPAVCPVLALGLYLLHFGACKSGVLFGGNFQDARFGNILHDYLTSDPHCKMLLENAGLVAAELGTHSLRKGSTTYTSSGSTEGPSFNSICQRAGWKLGTVQDKYLRFERASDEYTGRVVSGLPLQHEDFALLPPHFPLLDDEVDGIVKGVFDSDLLSYPHMRPVLRHTLASVVYHADYLLEALPQHSPLRKSWLLTNSKVFQSLRAKVVCHRNSEHMTSTGIPAHVAHIVSIRELKDRMAEVEAAVRSNNETIPATTVAGVESVLERRAHEQGNITASTVEGRVDSAVARSLAMYLRTLGVEDALQQALLHRQQQEGQDAASGEVQSRATSMLHLWEGKWHRVPFSWEPPRVSIKTGWVLWWLGEVDNKILPYRLFEPALDLKSKHHKMFSDWTVLFRGKFEVYLEKKGYLLSRNTPPTCENVQGMYDKLAPIIQLIPARNESRRNNLHVTTVTKLLRSLNVAAL